MGHSEDRHYSKREEEMLYSSDFSNHGLTTDVILRDGPFRFETGPVVLKWGIHGPRNTEAPNRAYAQIEIHQKKAGRRDFFL